MMRRLATFPLFPIQIVMGRVRAGIANDNVLLMILAVVAGLVGGYAALGFRAAGSAVTWLYFRTSSDQLIHKAHSLPWWMLLLLPAAGGLVVGVFNARFLNNRAAFGVAHIIECSMVHNAQVPLRTGLASAIASALSIGCGASVGREGSILHLASTLSSWIGRRFKLGPQHAHTILGCGVAAALSASFNAPIAGVFFALEVVLGHYALSAFAPIVISSVIGTIITRVHSGNFPAYVLPHYDLVTYWEIPALLLLGTFCAFVAIAFSAAIFKAQDLFGALRVPVWCKPAIGGLMVGAIALFAPEILGVGYQTTNAALNQGLGLALLLTFAILKIGATAISLGSGFGGGVFAPSLYVGATLGGACGIIAGSLFPHLGSHPGLYAIVGMASVSSAMLGAPISTILTVFELLGDFQVTIGVMSGAAVASLVIQQTLGKSFYTWQLERRGVVIQGARAIQILHQRTVAEIMTPPFQLVQATTTLADLKLLLQCLPENADAIVVEDGLKLVGTVSRDDLKDVAYDPLVDETSQIALYFTRIYPASLALRSSLDDALNIMREWGIEKLPVVKDRESGDVAGMLDYGTLLTAYNQALLQADTERGV